MRKLANNVLRNYLLQSGGKSECPRTEVMVIDSGELLFHISWNNKNTYEEIVQKYSRYIKYNLNQRNIIVFFDGNDDINSSKGEEHCRRGKEGSSALVNSKNPEAKPTCSKQSFLKIRHNKMQLISLLKPAYVKAGINVRQNHRDKGAMISKTTLTMSAEGKSYSCFWKGYWSVSDAYSSLGKEHENVLSYNIQVRQAVKEYRKGGMLEYWRHGCFKSNSSELFTVRAHLRRIWCNLCNVCKILLNGKKTQYQRLTDDEAN